MRYLTLAEVSQYIMMHSVSQVNAIACSLLSTKLRCIRQTVALQKLLAFGSCQDTCNLLRCVAVTMFQGSLSQLINTDRSRLTVTRPDMPLTRALLRYLSIWCCLWFGLAEEHPQLLPYHPCCTRCYSYHHSLVDVLQGKKPQPLL